MRYVGTFLNAHGTEVRRTFEAANENELRQRLKEEGLDIRELKIDGTLEVANAEGTLDNASKIISLIVIILTACLLFSLPFPFIRKIWFREALGYYGILNIICFAITVWGLKQKAVVAVTAGWAILFYEQLLTWQGFYLLYAQGSVTFTTWAFVGLSLVVTTALLFVYLKAFYAIRVYYAVRRAFQKEQETLALEKETYGQRFGVFCLYFLLPLAMVMVPSNFSSYYRLAAMRVLGEIACLISAVGIGFEIKRHFKTQAWNLPILAVIFFHATALIAMTFWIYFKTPLSQVYASL